MMSSMLTSVVLLSMVCAGAAAAVVDKTCTATTFGEAGACVAYNRARTTAYNDAADAALARGAGDSFFAATAAWMAAYDAQAVARTVAANTAAGGATATTTATAAVGVTTLDRDGNPVSATGAITTPIAAIATGVQVVAMEDTAALDSIITAENCVTCNADFTKYIDVQAGQDGGAVKQADIDKMRTRACYLPCLKIASTQFRAINPAGFMPAVASPFGSIEFADPTCPRTKCASAHKACQTSQKGKVVTAGTTTITTKSECLNNWDAGLANTSKGFPATAALDGAFVSLYSCAIVACVLKAPLP
jgi:hypothetical protein